MRIQWEQSIYGGTVPVTCTICGERITSIRNRRNLYLLAVIYNQQGRVCGEACRSCVAAGPQEIQERLQERICQLEATLGELQALAGEGVEVPTLEEEFNTYSPG